jgi:hypothetical protein
MDTTIQREALCSIFPTKYYSGNQINKNGKGGACDKCGGRRDAYRVLVERSDGKRPFVRDRRRWENN